MQIYVHIPFCKSKCQYCDFNSYSCCDEATVFSYISAVVREIIFASKQFEKSTINTVYIGGGTPSFIDDGHIGRIAKAIKDNFLCDISEFTIECNPESVTQEKLEQYKQFGINRISLGVQSLDDRNLRAVGRIHTAEQAENALNLIKSYFENVSGDLIIGLPFDTAEIIENEVSKLCGYVKHLSMYELSVEDGTKLCERVKKQEICLPSDDEVVDLFSTAINVSKSFDFNRYEVSNFSKAGFEAVHNFGYWTREEYLGIGAGASSFLKTTNGQTLLQKQIRFSSPKNINAYIGGVNCAPSFDKIPRIDYEILNEDEQEKEIIMLGLRTSKGISSKLLDGKISNDIAKYFERSGDNLNLTDDGFQIMNTILCKIL